MRHQLCRLSVPVGIAVLCLGLAGCGGGGGGSPPVATGPVVSPPDPSTPVGAFMAYVIQLVTSPLDTSEPTNVAAFDPPPLADTSEPITTR